MGEVGPDPATREERQLIRSVCTGEAAAFAPLVRKYQAPLFLFILRRVRNAADAEDLAQETFLDAFKGLAGFNGGSRFSTWLFGIALNKVRNHINRSPQWKYPHGGGDLLTTLSVGEAPDLELERRRYLLALDHAIGKLPPDQREILLMVSIEGFSYEEAARLARVPVGTVKSKLFRARARLAQQLGGNGAAGERKPGKKR